MGIPQHGCFILRNPVKLDDLGVPPVLGKPPYVYSQWDLTNKHNLGQHLHLVLDLWTVMNSTAETACLLVLLLLLHPQKPRPWSHHEISTPSKFCAEWLMFRNKGSICNVVHSARVESHVVHIYVRHVVHLHIPIALWIWISSDMFNSGVSRNYGHTPKQKNLFKENMINHNHTLMLPCFCIVVLQHWVTSMSQDYRASCVWRIHWVQNQDRTPVFCHCLIMFFPWKLVGGFNHLEKYEFVNGKDDIPYMKWKIENVWNHQPENAF